MVSGMAAVSLLFCRLTAPAAMLRGLATSGSASLRRSKSFFARYTSPRTARVTGLDSLSGTALMVFMFSLTSLPT